MSQNIFNWIPRIFCYVLPSLVFNVFLLYSYYKSNFNNKS